MAIRRIMLAYSNTGKGHQSVASALVETIISAQNECPPPRVQHVDIYQLANVFLFRSAGRQYEVLCRHLGWLYDILFRITDNPTAKSVIADAVLRVYGPVLEREISRINPDTIVVLHPLFVSDVLCKLRSRLNADWTIISLVTDLGVAHAGWTAPGLDSVLFVSRKQVQKLRSQGCLPPDSLIAATRAPVRSAFAENNSVEDQKVVNFYHLKRPYLLYIPGIQSPKAIWQQVSHLANDYSEMTLVLVGSYSPRLVGHLRDIQPDLVHLRELPSFEMAALFRNAEIVAGKTGPAVMAEAARVGARFLPTAEVGRQEAGNALAGRSLYSIDRAPKWGHVYKRMRNAATSDFTIPGQCEVIEETEVLRLLVGDGADDSALNTGRTRLYSRSTLLAAVAPVRLALL
jgi:hypothetical protein